MTTNIDIITPKITQACRICRNMRPNISTSAKGYKQKFMTERKLLHALGFSKGWAELAPKNPPPFVPKCLMGIMAATGPRQICCACAWPCSSCPIAPCSTVATWAAPRSVMGTPSAMSTTPMMRLAGTNVYATTRHMSK